MQHYSEEMHHYEYHTCARIQYDETQRNDWSADVSDEERSSFNVLRTASTINVYELPKRIKFGCSKLSKNVSQTIDDTIERFSIGRPI